MKLIDDNAVFWEATSLPSLREAWGRVRANAGAAGGDRMTIERFSHGSERRLLTLSKELRSGRHLPSPVRRVDIPKPSGDKRRLIIPSVVDRIAQLSVAQALGSQLDPGFEDSSFGYRPGRSVKQAIRLVEATRNAGSTWIVDADIKDFFDSVPHARLLQRLDEIMTDGPLIQLIEIWLEHNSQDGKGLAQGSPLSPLLSNLYLDHIDKAFSGKGSKIVRYADDFIILCKSEKKANKAHAKVQSLLRKIGLSLNREKSQVVSFNRGFRFLGHLFVRNIVLVSPREEDKQQTDEVLQLIANADSENRRKDKKHRDEVSAGYQHRHRVLYVMTAGRRLSVRNRSFAVEEATSGGTESLKWRELLALPHDLVDRIEIGGDADITPEASLLGMDTETLIARVDGHGQTLGWSAPALAPQATRQLAQARLVLDVDRRLDLAKILVDGRLRNQRALLRRLNYKRKNPEISKALTEINRWIVKIPTIKDIPTLMGCEGRVAALYWSSFAKTLPAGARFEQRKRKKDGGKVNAMLNLLATLLAREVSAAIWRAGLNPGFGVLHATNDQRDAAVFDLIEEFRAPLAESPVAYSLNNRIVQTECDEKVNLAREDVSAIIGVFEAALSRVLKYPRTKERKSWREIIGDQAYLFAAHMEGEAVYSPMIMDY